MADYERMFSGLYAGNQDFRPGRGQPGTGLRYPYQKQKTPRIGPLFLAKPAILFAFFAVILFYFSTLVRRGGRDVPSLAASLQLGKIHYGMKTSIWRQIRHIDNGSEKEKCLV